MTNDQLKERIVKCCLVLYRAFEDSDNAVITMITETAYWDVAKDTIHMPFGYARPAREVEDGPIVWAVCPDMIVEQTQHLDEQEFSEYLSYIIGHTALHVIYFNDDYTLGELERVVDQTLHEAIPDSMIAIAVDVMQRASS